MHIPLPFAYHSSTLAMDLENRTLTDKPFEEQDIVDKLLIRAAIRRKIGRKADGKEDRIALTCEEAAKEILELRAFRDDVFKLHPNIDIDISYLEQ